MIRFIAVLLMLMSGCGYYKTTSRTAKDIKSIHVPFFENKTPEPNLEIAFTELLILNLVTDNTLKVVGADDADATLDGVIVTFENRPFSFNADLNAEEYRVIIMVTATLYSNKTNEPLWSGKSFRGDGAYFPDGGGQDFDFKDAREEAVLEITDQILVLTVQDW